MSAHTDISGGVPQGGVAAFRLIDNQLGRVKELINEQLAATAKAKTVSRLLKNVNANSGKMLRPGLVLLSYYAVRDEANDSEFGIRNSKLNRHDELTRIAAIVEIIHNATLLHDDVIDEGQRRRGLPTVNSLWGNESAVLLGDFLLSQVFKMCVDLEPRFQRIIAATTAQVCEGELRQVVQRQNWQLSESEYIDIITEKSASFFSSCCCLGGLLARASEAQVRMLAEFGRNVGIGFQITDDLLDIIGDESKTGKTPGSDVDKNKLTLAVIHLLRTVNEKERAEVINSLCTRRDERYEKETLAEKLRCFGSLEYARGRAQGYAAKGVEALAGLKESEAKDALIETARFVASRANIS